MILLAKKARRKAKVTWLQQERRGPGDSGDHPSQADAGGTESELAKSG